MDCKTVHENILALTEGALPEDLQRSILEHTRICGSCTRLAEGFKSVESIIASERETAPNPFTKTRILQHIETTLDERQHMKLPQFKRVLQPVLITLSLFVALFIGFILGKQANTPTNAGRVVQAPVENLKSDLFIQHFIDEDKTLFDSK
jgi:hypothetical protein